MWFDEDCKQLTDRLVADHAFSQGHLNLDPVTIATSVLLLQDVASSSQVGDDAKNTPLCDSQCRGNVAKANTGIVRDADEDPGVVGQKAPFAHTDTVTHCRNILLVSNH